MANNGTSPGRALAVFELLQAQLIGYYTNFLLLKDEPYLCALTHEALELIYSGIQELPANIIIAWASFQRNFSIIILANNKRLAFEHKWEIFCEPCSVQFLW